jgi:hypothetical protein
MFRIRKDLRAFFGNAFGSFGRRRVLPPLPWHAERGLQVQTGDSFVIKEMSISLEDLNETEARHPRVLPVRLPPWANEFPWGVVFGLTRRLDEAWYRVDKHRVDIGADRTLMVSLSSVDSSPLEDAFTVAERMLDLLAANSFRISTLDDPLREHGMWLRGASGTTLQIVTTARLGVRIRSVAEVRDPGGALRQQPPRPAIAWHPSHAYFRRSQASDSLHEAYRNMFLALESLLSHVYPWDYAMGEAAWIRAALEHVCEGYSVNLKQYVGGAGGNPYKRFIKEQYRANRCALFHAKLSEAPISPDDISTRAELRDATRRLGQLYVTLAQRITGSAFGGGTMTTAAFDRMMQSQAKAVLYVSGESNFHLDRIHESAADLILNAGGNRGVHNVQASWLASRLPQHLCRAGSIMMANDQKVEGLYAELDVDVRGADHLKVVFQNELGNAEHLREWFL